MLQKKNSRFFLVTVGNIPYEATEEQLKDIFSEVGLVVSFRYAQSLRQQHALVTLRKPGADLELKNNLQVGVWQRNR